MKLTIFHHFLDNGELYVWGSGSEGQLGIGVDECERPVLLKFKSKIRVVSCGYYHTAFVTGKNIYFSKLKCEFFHCSFCLNLR